MRHFIFEFITGGGLAGQDLSESLVKEGELMLQALVDELMVLNLELTISRDSRLEKLNNNVEHIFIEKDLGKSLEQLIKNADVCWLIAPESDGCLANFANMFSNSKTMFIGSSLEAIKLTSSKYATNKLLFENNIKVIETRKINDILPDSKTGWVVKPDDGVGAEDACLIEDEEQLLSFVSNQSNNNYIVQPYIEGNHLSMSLLVCSGDVRLLACNKQYVDINKNGIKLLKIGVNEELLYKDKMGSLAKSIVSAIPGLSAYIGVDLIEKDGELYVLEINPRLTTAYAGLATSLGRNVAKDIMGVFKNNKLPDIDLNSAKSVMIKL